MALQTRQSSRVEQTKGQLHIWISCIVDTPRKMKMRVSLTLLHIFRKYWMLVLLRSDTFASTYCFMVTAQVTMLQKKQEKIDVGLIKCYQMFTKGFFKFNLMFSSTHAMIPER